MRFLYDLGEHVTRSINLTNTSGVAVDADSTPTYVLTAPDGTTVASPTPGAVNHGSTGEYFVNLVPSSLPTAGRYLLDWTAVVGGLTVTHHDELSVTSGASLVSVSEAVQHLRASGIITLPDDLEELRWLCAVAADAVDRDLGRAVSRRTVVESHDGGRTSVLLRSTPVSSITSVTENGNTITSAGYTLDAQAGILHRGAPTAEFAWVWGRQNIVVTFVAGYTAPPVVARKVALNIIEAAWQSSQQSPHPALDFDSAAAVAVTNLTNQEQMAYASLRAPGLA